MSEMTFVPADTTLYAPVREITGTPEAFMRLFGKASGTYGQARIVSDPTWGVRIEFTGHWWDNYSVRVPGPVAPAQPKPPSLWSRLWRKASAARAPGHGGET